MSNKNLANAKSYINIRVDTATKQKLEQQAAAEMIPLPDYIRKHYFELANQGVISPEEDVKISNPYGQQQMPQTPYQPIPPYPYMPAPYPGGYPQQVVMPDAMDQMINEMRKLVVVKMMKELLREPQTPEQMIAAYAGKPIAPKEDMSMNDMLKYQMMMNQMESQKLSAQRQWEDAHNRGDTAGESKSLELITALTTAQMQQQQNFMQQFMLAQQNAQNVQQSLFTTALQTNRSSEDAARAEREKQAGSLEGIRTQMFQGQLAGAQQLSQVQMDFMKAELDRIRNEGGKGDLLKQLNDLLVLRQQSPIYKAAFDAAFGVKEEGGIAGLLPKLKDMGIDKIIDKVIGGVAAIAGARMGGGGAPPMPTEMPPQPAEMPPPMAPPTPEELAKLQLPDEGQPLQEQQPENPPDRITIERPDNVGYSNIEAETGQKDTITIENPETEQQPQPEPQPESKERPRRRRGPPAQPQ